MQFSICAAAQRQRGIVRTSLSSMKKIWIVLAALFLSSILACAQDRPSWEIFVGYQYTYANTHLMEDTGNAMASAYGNSLTLDHNLTMTGANLSFQRNVGKRWAAVLDLGGMRANKDVDISQIFQLLGYIPGGSSQTSTFTQTFYHVMVGPQYDLLKIHRAQIFVRAMGGGARTILTMDDTTRKALTFLAPKYKTTTTDPAVIAGAGVQYRVYHNIFVRGTADYVHPFSSSSQNYFRITGGIGLERLGRLF